MAWVVVVFALVLVGLFEVWRRHRLATRHIATFEELERKRQELFDIARAQLRSVVEYIPEHWEWRRR